MLNGFDFLPPARSGRVVDCDVSDKRAYAGWRVIEETDAAGTPHTLASWPHNSPGYSRSLG